MNTSLLYLTAHYSNQRRLLLWRVKLFIMLTSILHLSLISNLFSCKLLRRMKVRLKRVPLYLRQASVKEYDPTDELSVFSLQGLDQKFETVEGLEFPIDADSGYYL